MYYSVYLFALSAVFASGSLAQRGSHPAKVLIYSATKGYRHDSILTAIQSLKAKGPSINVQFDNTEDSGQFNDQILAQYDALLFLDTTSQVLHEPGIVSFQNYLDLGGNFVGVHAAFDCLVHTTFYGQESGAYFNHHQSLQTAMVDVIDPYHPSTSMLPARWHVHEGLYNVKPGPRAIGAVVVLSASESDSGRDLYGQGTPHPMAWYQERGTGTRSSTVGRRFYTSLGHSIETWRDELFVAHVTGGIIWTLLSNTTRAYNNTASVGNVQSPYSSVISSGSSTSSKPTSSTTSDVQRQPKPFENPVIIITLIWSAYTFFQGLI